MDAGAALSPTTIYDHALAALLGLILPLATILRRVRQGAQPQRFESWEKIASYWSNSALLAILAGAALWSWQHSGRTWRELGLAEPPAHLDWGLLLAFLFSVFYTVDTWWQLAPGRIAATRARWRRDTPFMPRTARELRHSLALVACAAVAEEILFRGFLIWYVARFSGTKPAGLSIAVALPAVVFAVSHLYQGRRAVAKIAVLAGLSGALFVVTGSLWIPIALHFLVDLVGVLLGPKLLAERAVASG